MIFLKQHTVSRQDLPIRPNSLQRFSHTRAKGSRTRDDRFHRRDVIDLEKKGVSSQGCYYSGNLSECQCMFQAVTYRLRSASDGALGRGNENDSLYQIQPLDFPL